jgi:hypothetical protein
MLFICVDNKCVVIVINRGFQYCISLILRKYLKSVVKYIFGKMVNLFVFEVKCFCRQCRDSLACSSVDLTFQCLKRIFFNSETQIR